MYVDKLVIKLKCCKHPRYDPITQGEDGIKGGCVDCYAVNRVWEAAVKIREQIRDFGIGYN